jgi:putative NADH-flavin reductase
MKIAVFGSTGGNGRLVLDRAVLSGHLVTAFARRPEALSAVPGLAAVIEGDAREQQSAAKAIAGQDAVIMTVSGRGEPGVAVGIAKAVTEAMASLGVTRLVATSSYGMIATRPLLVASLVRRIFRDAFADQLAADKIVENSGLDWTIMRATRLISGPGKQSPRLSTELFAKGPFSLARVSYAAALIESAETKSFIRQTVNITG